MTQALALDSHDALFASRTTADEWNRIAAFRNSAHFCDGARRHEGVMAPFFSNNLILNKVVLEAWRFQMIVFTLYLHDTRDAGDPRSGLTFANLSRICKELELASTGRVYAFLNLMRAGGYLDSIRSAADSRIVHYAPTPAFMEKVHAWNDGIFAAIDAAKPDCGFLAKQDHIPELGKGMRVSGAERLLTGWKPLDPFPEVTHFANADGGWMLMEQIVARSLCHADGIIVEPVSINLRHFGRDFGGSRSNLLRLLEGAYQAGLLEAPPQGGAHIHFTSRMTCAFLSFIASYLDNYERCTRVALARLAAAENPQIPVEVDK
jgi:hypothetical protein